MESDVIITPKAQYSDLYQHHLKEIMKGDIRRWYNTNNQRKNIPHYTTDGGEDVAYFYANKITELQNMWSIKEITGKSTDQNICEFWILSLLNKYLLNPFTLPAIKVTTISVQENNEKKDAIYNVVKNIITDYNYFSLKKWNDFERFMKLELDKIFVVVDRADDLKDIMKQEHTLDALFADETIPIVEYLQNIWVCDNKNILNCVKLFFMDNKYCVSDIVALFKKDNVWFLRYLKIRYSKQMQIYHADKNQDIDDNQKKVFDEITKKYTTAYSALKKYLQDK